MTDRIWKSKSMEIWFHITGQNTFFSLVLLVIPMFWSYMIKLLPFVNLSTIYEKTKWVPVSINWGNSASSLLATTAFINFQLTDGPSTNIWINLDMFKQEIPWSKFFNRSVKVPWPKNIESQYQTWTLFFMESQYLTNKSFQTISHSWTVVFRLSSKILQNT